MVSNELLVKHGFIKGKKKFKYFFDENKQLWKARKGEKFSAKDADVEIAEDFNVGNEGYVETGYPQPGKRYRVVKESFAQGIEENYFWVLNFLRQDGGFSTVDKITDIFSASENSSFFGASQMKLSAQQDKISQYLRGVSEMVKQLFAIVRELRIIDERLVLYNRHFDKDKISKSADNTLKGLYIDLVEGGTKNPGSIIGLATQVGYTILPDLFFNSTSRTKEQVDREVESLKYNPQVTSILRRKLYAYLVWVEKTFDEHKVRKKFQLQYLRQHWTTINMYMSWIKPYLKNTTKLTMSQQHLDSPYLVGSFETSMTEVEILAYKKSKSDYHPCILANFEFRTKPHMTHRTDYQQGPQHVGRVTITLRSYAWSTKEVEAYKRMKNEEDMELLGLVDSSVKNAMDALGDEFVKYLKEAEEPIKEEAVPEDEKKRFNWDQSVLGPFIAMGSGFKDIFQAFSGVDFGVKGSKKDKGSRGPAMGDAKASMWPVYKYYKKSHGMLTW